MSHAVRQGLFIAAIGVMLGATTTVLARRQLISLRYAVGWMAISVAAIVGAAINPVVTPIAERLGMTPTGLLLALASMVLLAITVQLSISVSGLRAQVRELAEAHALAPHVGERRADGHGAPPT